MKYLESVVTYSYSTFRPEKSFAELLEEVMGKAPEEQATETPTSSTLSRLNRRGKWKKTRLSSGADNNENFETAESQNLGPQLINSLYSASEKTEDAQKTTTTPMTPATEAQTTEAITTTAAPLTTPEEYEVTTAKTADITTIATTLAMSEDSATRRMDTAADVDGDVAADDLDTQPSIFSEVRQQLHDLFAIDESEDEAVTAALAAVGKRRQEYTSIKRPKLATPTESTTEASNGGLAATTVATPSDKDNFHKDLMEHVVYATSTSTKVTSETEICYRGRCIRSEDLPANHKLHWAPAEQEPQPVHPCTPPPSSSLPCKYIGASIPRGSEMCPNYCATSAQQFQHLPVSQSPYRIRL